MANAVAAAVGFGVKVGSVDVVAVSFPLISIHPQTIRFMVSNTHTNVTSGQAVGGASAQRGPSPRCVVRSRVKEGGKCSTEVTRDALTPQLPHHATSLAFPLGVREVNRRSHLAPPTFVFDVLVWFSSSLVMES